MRNISKYQWATAIAILFHSIGLIGIVFFQSDSFIKTTPLNLLLMGGLLVFTTERKNNAFALFFLLCFFAGIAVEVIGTSTGWLFGHYTYGKMLGPVIMDVPILIGINWFIIMYCCGVSIHMLHSSLSASRPQTKTLMSKNFKMFSVLIDGALLAVFFDWVMEPVAIKLGYWQWLADGEIPLYNYICWFAISVLLLFVFQKLPFTKQNKFAVNLLLIQAMFFLLLRTFL